MSEFERHDLGLVDFLQCEAIGEPGQRTFNITARSERGEAIVWMEKEQLFQVGISVKQFLVTRESTPDPAPFDVPAIDSPVPVHVEFKTGEMSLRHDPASDVFTLVASDIPREDSVDGPLAEITMSFNREQAEQISDRSIERAIVSIPSRYRSMNRPFLKACACIGTTPSNPVSVRWSADPQG